MIYLSDQLLEEYPKTYRQLHHALRKSAVAYRLLSGTADVWMRDYMPVRRTDGRGWVQFDYHPSYLKGYEELRTDTDSFVRKLRLRRLNRSALKLDGGNLIQFNGLAIVTERVYLENTTMTPAVIRRELIASLGLHRLVMIPAESPEEDMTGHADGMCRLIDERTVLLNDFALNPVLGGRVFLRLRRAGLRVIRLRVPPALYRRGHDWAPYINYLETANVIFVPVLEIPGERRVVAQLRHIFHKKKIVPVRADELVEEGGALNCVSWEI